MEYFIGVDGGGTKTALCALRTDNYEMSRLETSGTSWKEHGVAKVVSTLRKSVKELVKDNRDKVSGIVMGLPCYGESIEGDLALAADMREAFTPIPVVITNDVEVGWAGSLALEPGINIVSGTGSIAFGKNLKGKSARTGGWSEFYGDEGSCYWVGRKLMEYFSKQADGRMPKDELYEMVCKAFGLKRDMDFVDIIDNKYKMYRKQVASLQLIAEKAALAGSAAAKSIYEDAVKELVMIVSALKEQLSLPKKSWKVSYSGGLFKAKELVLEPFTKEIKSLGGKVLVPCFEPVEGAVLLALMYFAKDSFKEIPKFMEAAK